MRPPARGERAEKLGSRYRVEKAKCRACKNDTLRQGLPRRCRDTLYTRYVDLPLAQDTHFNVRSLPTHITDERHVFLLLFLRAFRLSDVVHVFRDSK